MISVIVTSRVDGNINHNINELVRSLAEHSRKPEDIELLVKFDNDDPQAYGVQLSLMEKDLPFLIKMTLGPRGRGYTDIHHGYNQLLTKLDRESAIVIAMADDFRAERDWDNALLNAAQGAGDYFIIHQRPHARHNTRWPNGPDGKADYAKADKFCLEDNMFEGENLYIIDEAPAWSRKLLEAAYIGISQHTIFPVSFTDAWTLCLEWCLWHNHQINITKFLPEVFINRKTCEVDQPTNARWNTDRKINFDFIKSEDFRRIVARQASNIASQICAGVK